MLCQSLFLERAGAILSRDRTGVGNRPVVTFTMLPHLSIPGLGGGVDTVSRH